MNAEYGMVMPFKDESSSFVHGFEAGILWEKMCNNEKFEKYLIHTKNIEQIEMMCRRFHYYYRFENYSEDWSYLFAEIDTQLAN